MEGRYAGGKRRVNRTPLARRELEEQSTNTP
jgi:hypothetical protein